jgi:steroid 5-alpha reductase family enzyme
LNTFLLLLLVGWLVAAGMMVLMFAVQRRIGDAGIVDIAWALGVGGLGTVYALIADGLLTRRIMIVLVVAIWAARLGYYIYRRVISMPEDGRYQTLKEQWGSAASKRMFRFYQMQALGVVLFSTPILIAASNPHPLHWLDIVGVTLGAVGIFGESMADFQLSRFRRNLDNQGKVCQDGLWYYSRHPNYFFEWLHWWAYVLLAITYPWGWLTLIGPLSMWYFITQVTGIPPTEAQAIKSRGEAYRHYQRTTNAFFPGPRRLRFKERSATDQIAT